jgi:hypothetical protein
MNLALFMAVAQSVANVIAPKPAASAVLLPGAVELAWETAPGMTYRVYYAGQTLTWNGAPVTGKFPGSYEQAVDVGTNGAMTIGGLEPNRVYYFSVTATDTNGAESDLSPPFAQTSQPILVIHFPASSMGVEASTNLFDWQPRAALQRGVEWHMRFNPAVPREFYRTAVFNSQPTTNN